MEVYELYQARFVKDKDLFWLISDILGACCVDVNGTMVEDFLIECGTRYSYTRFMIDFTTFSLVILQLQQFLSNPVIPCTRNGL